MLVARSFAVHRKKETCVLVFVTSALSTKLVFHFHKILGRCAVICGADGPAEMFALLRVAFCFC